MMKKIIAMILIIAYMMMPVYKVERPSIIGKCGNKTSVNVDGRQYDVIVNEDNIVVESNTKENKQKMVLDLKGNAKIFTVDNEGNKQTARMKIDEMSKNNFKAVVTFEDGTTKRYNSIDDLGPDRYVGKNVASALAFAMAIPLGKLAAAALVKAVIATGTVVAGTALLAATINVAGEVYERLDELINKKRPPEVTRYYKAYLDKVSNAVYILPNPISYKEAQIRMNTGFNVYTPKKNDAFKLAESAGSSPSGLENHGKEKNGKRVKPGIYYDHYHPWHRRSHIFFGDPHEKK